jgi:hypothetical protein
MKQINLIPEEWRYIFPLRPIILGIVLVILLSANYLAVNNRKEAVTAARAELMAELNLLEELEQSSPAINIFYHEQIIERVSRLTAAKNRLAAQRRPYWQDLLLLSVLAKETAKEAENEIFLRKIELSKREGMIKVEVVVPSFEAGAAYLEQVRSQDAFREVMLVKGEGKAVSDQTILEVRVLLEE